MQPIAQIWLGINNSTFTEGFGGLSWLYPRQAAGDQRNVFMGFTPERERGRDLGRSTPEQGARNKGPERTIQGYKLGCKNILLKVSVETW